jgi:hypothetical protein
MLTATEADPRAAINTTAIQNLRKAWLRFIFQTSLDIFSSILWPNEESKYQSIARALSDFTALKS